MLAVKMSTPRVLYASRYKLQGSACAKLQQSTRQYNTTSFFDRWFSVPKGFKKFYPKEGKGPSGSAKTEAGGAKNAKDKGSESK